MDAQNAAGPDKTKPAAAAASESTKRPDHDPDQNRSSSSSTSAKPSATTSKSSPNADKDVKPNANPSADAGDDRSVADAASSDAETIVLPGKDGHSPSKVRKVKHENRSDDDTPVTARKSRDRDHGIDQSGQRDHRDKERDKDASHKDGSHSREKERERERSATTGASASASNSAAPSPSLKKKRLPDKLSENKPSLPAPGQRNKDTLVSTPTSPPPKRRRSTDANPRQSHADSDSDNARHRSPKASKDRAKSSDKVIPHKRKAPKVESEDEEEQRKARRQRTAPASTGPSGGDSHSTSHSHAHAHPSKHGRDQQKSSRPHDQATTRGRSVSPQPRPHRRSTSTQLPAQSITGLSQKKKRVPAPLQSTDYHSDESSASGSPHPRSSKLRSLATPATADSTISPAKMAPHKKHLDAHGQTFLARACARGEYEQAKQRLTERPDDLNVADYAGNTPLQIAAINGCEDIVKLLIDAGCNLDCVNYDKDTPLLDAVDNGHLGVIKLLLDAGVNPRKANVNGEEPIDRVNDDMDNADEIRAILKEARQRIGDRRRTSEEHHNERTDSRPSHGPESPRRSPVATSHGAAASGRRSTNMRATKTSNHLLYMPMDDKTLRQAAGRGDEETVTRILQVRDGCDDPEAMVNAARGGHDLVMQLLLALGGANPDPPPVPNVAPDVATPMLAAIGQENIKVIQLLLDQSNFDPTRRFKGDTYYEIARRRAGPNWKEEEHILQKAYDEYKKSRSKESSKKSPSRREREKEREEREHKRASRNEAREESARSVKRNNAASPSRDVPELKKKTVSSSKAALSPKEKKRSEPSTRHDDHHTSPKRGPGRPKKDVPSIAVSDRENSPAVHKQTKTKRTESDLAAISSEGETAKPRRKLISKGELRSEREKQRRTSQVSTGSSMKDPASPQDSRADDHPEKEKLKGEKYHDRTKAIKRDESKDRLSVSGENSAKRHRSSATPPHSVSGDKDDSEVPTKRRRLDADGKERRPKLSSSTAEDRPAKSNLSREQSLARSMKSAKASAAKPRDDDDKKEPKAKKSSDAHRRESAKSTSSEKSIHVKYEDADVDMADAPPLPLATGAEARSKDNHQHHSQDKKRSADDAEATTSKEEKKRRDAEEKEKEKERERRKKREEEEARRLEEEAKRKEAEERRRQKEEEEKKRRAEEEKERKRREEEEQRRKEEEEKKRKEEEEKRRKEEEEKKRREEEERKKKAEEEERKRKEEEERLRREEEKRRKREEEERKRLEEEERKRKEEEEKKRREEEERRRKEEEERKRKEEEERKQREERERLRREQLEREAAEAARRKREEEERREREHRERQRAAREAEIRRQREEQERIRLAKLPPLLRWLDICPNPKSTDVAEKFKHMQGVRYDTIRPETTGTADGREQWVLNTQVALLLGEKDLALSRYTAWEKIPVSNLAKKSIWRLECDRYALISDDMFELGLQLPNYYGEGVDPCRMNYKVIERLRSEAWDKFLKLDMFFVKLSDLMFIVPTIPHLRGIKLSVEYRELPETESELYGWKASQKWKQDPNADRFYGFAPRNKYYINGALVGEERPGLSATSSEPFPERRVPRRNGFQQVFPDDPEYARLCKEQGLEHLLEDESRGVPMTNGVRTNGPVSAPGAQVPNGTTHAESGSAAAGSSPTTVASSRSIHSPQQHYRPLVNGVNGTSN